jgi:hypothetical protein
MATRISSEQSETRCGSGLSIEVPAVPRSGEQVLRVEVLLRQSAVIDRIIEKWVNEAIANLAKNQSHIQNGLLIQGGYRKLKLAISIR